MGNECDEDQTDKDLETCRVSRTAFALIAVSSASASRQWVCWQEPFGCWTIILNCMSNHLCASSLQSSTLCGCMHAVIEENHLPCAESVGLRKYAVKSDVFNALWSLGWTIKHTKYRKDPEIGFVFNVLPALSCFQKAFLCLAIDSIKYLTTLISIVGPI